MHVMLLYPLYIFFKECVYYELDPQGIGSLTWHILGSDFQVSCTNPDLDAYNTQGPKTF